MGALCSSLASVEGFLASMDGYLASIDDYLASIQDTLGLPKRRSYHDLPPELLDLVIAGLRDPADRARARAVCRSWHDAVRRHGTQPWRMPSTMCSTHHLRSLPHGANTVGSTNDWLAVRVGEKRGKYLLHNPFFNKTVPLAELEAIIDHDESIIHKFLMRSSADDLIAVTTNNMRYAFMVIRPGKGVWLPPPWTRPYVDIIDFAFLQGKLYAITRADDLIPFDLQFDDDGSPVVTMGRRLIKKSPDYNGQHGLAAALPDITILNNAAHVWSPTTESKHDLYITSRHLIESQGKLLIVRHHMQIRGQEEMVRHLMQARGKKDYCPVSAYVTRGVEVFEADPSAGAWTPVTGGLGGGRALFISKKFSKSVAAPCGEVDEDAIYFMGTCEVFNLKTGTCSPSQLCWPFGPQTWLFHPELVF